MKLLLTTTSRESSPEIRLGSDHSVSRRSDWEVAQHHGASRPPNPRHAVHRAEARALGARQVTSIHRPWDSPKGGSNTALHAHPVGKSRSELSARPWSKSCQVSLLYVHRVDRLLGSEAPTKSEQRLRGSFADRRGADEFCLRITANTPLRQIQAEHLSLGGQLLGAPQNIVSMHIMPCAALHARAHRAHIPAASSAAFGPCEADQILEKT